MVHAEWLGLLRKSSESEDDRRLTGLVSKSRPPPLRQYDQIYMKGEYLCFQTKLMASELANKKVVFMGDGDNMSLMFGLFAMDGKIEQPDHMLVLDFDQRILRHIENFSKIHNFDYMITTKLYNVKWELPEEYLYWGEFFYTNPVYSSKTEPKGQGALIFIDRCLNFCASQCSGCVLLPYDCTRPWTQEVNKTIQPYFIDVGCYIREMVPDMHAYHLDDDPNLRSATMIIDRLELKGTKFEMKELCPGELRYFYGSSDEPMPECIDEDGNPIFKKE
jgi:predicted methyltransferase